jgi:uncharacterized protein (DUF983 family)
LRLSSDYYLFKLTWIALAAVLLSYAARKTSGISVEVPELYLGIGIAVGCVYHLAARVRSYALRYLYMLSMLIGILLMFLLFQLPLPQWAVILLLLSYLLCMGYFIPCIPLKGRIIPLREIPYVKIGIIIWAWWAGTVMLPVYYGNAEVDLLVLESISYNRILMIFFSALLCDMGDMQEDASKGLKTIALALGKHMSVGIVFIASILWAVYNLNHKDILVILTTTCFAILVSVYALRSTESLKVRFISDGILVLYGLLHFMP